MIRLHQHALPIAEIKTAKANGSAPSPPTDYRPIHVSTFDRRGRDLYAKPDWVTEALLRRLQFRGPIWEPCCGAGAMATVLAVHGYQVVSTTSPTVGLALQVSISWRAEMSKTDAAASLPTLPGEAAIHEGQPRSSRSMLDFLRHALALTATVQGQLALLVRLQWIAGKRVAEVMTTAPFAAVLVLTQRIRWFDMGERASVAVCGNSS